MSNNKRNALRPALSKNLLEMKFMKKSKTKAEIEKIEIEKQRIFQDAVKDKLATRGRKRQFVIDDSYVSCENLIFGRLSFRGQNPEIEKLMLEKASEREQKRIDDIEVKGTISAEEMAKRYSTLVGTISKKFLKKKRRSDTELEEIKPKQVFLKPS